MYQSLDVVQTQASTLYYHCDKEEVLCITSHMSSIMPLKLFDIFQTIACGHILRQVSTTDSSSTTSSAYITAYNAIPWKTLEESLPAYAIFEHAVSLTVTKKESASTSLENRKKMMAKGVTYNDCTVFGVGGTHSSVVSNQRNEEEEVKVDDDLIMGD